MRVMLAGSGKIVYHLAKQFIRKHLEVIIVTPDEDEAKELAARLSAAVFAGDATEPAVMEEAGAVKADVAIALYPKDEDNLAVCQTAGKIYNVPRTIALVNDPENEDIFRKLNVSVAVSATRVLSVLFEEQAGLEAISKLVTVGAGDVSVSEITLSPGAAAGGRPLKEIPLPKDALIGGIIREGKVIIPRGETVIECGDRLIVISTHTSLNKTVETLIGGTGGKTAV